MVQGNQQLDQNSDLNNAVNPDIQGSVGQLTGLQPNTGAQGLGLNAGLGLMEAGLISAMNRKKTSPQINQGQNDNAEEDEEQTDEAALNQNIDYRINVIIQNSVEQNLASQSQSNQCLIAPNQMEKDVDIGFAPDGIQEKPKTRKRSKKKASAGGLHASDEPSQSFVAQVQTKYKTSTVPKPKTSSNKEQQWSQRAKANPQKASSEEEDDQNP
ncbi:MAG: hypothetical protein EZS28_013502 [Streblomastix strix]|uniref:Uncharacterized protein n=1 Tax=Streblomastix strix TaxID=222440 RepID=A0A5J4W8N1_9EUKA|nr:MAG: hypothetical protein EZS28_013502 [Streblomastix strix]